MLGEEFLEIIGYPAFVVVILGVFWKGDDALSDEFKRDISDWMRGLSPPDTGPIPVMAMGRIMDRLFGPVQLEEPVGHDLVFPSHPTKRFIAVSLILSAATSLIVFPAIYSSMNDTSVIYALTGQDVVIVLREAGVDASGFAYGFIFAAVAALLVNCTYDIGCALFTRGILHSIECGCVSLKSAVLIDLFGKVLFLVFPFFLGPLLFVIATFLLRNISPDLTFKLLVFAKFNMFALPISVLVTGLLTSVWLWAAAFGAAVIRMLSKMDWLLRFMNYALPIDEKPMRSISVVLFAIALVIAGPYYSYIHSSEF
ncbi:MAG: hypothetical protein ABJI96_08235 [Paracoccaceae bacterium]